MNRKIVLAAILLLPFFLGCVPEKYQFVNEIGKAGSGAGEFQGAVDLALSADGNLVVCDAGNNRLMVLGSDGSMKKQVGEYGTTGYKLQGIAGCGVNALNGDYWVADQRGHKLVKFDHTGTPMLKISDKNVRFPQDVAIDHQGNAYVLMTRQPQVSRFNGQGMFIDTVGGTGKSALVHPTSITMAEGHMFIADYGGRRVVKLTLKGEFVQEFTKKGEYEDLKGPSSLFVNAAGNLLLLDLGDVPIAVIAPDGKLVSRVGSFGSERGQFLYPKGIVESAEGEIFVLDNSRNVILRFKKIAQ